MTDQIPADVTPEDMAHARAYVQDFLDATYAPDRTLAVARVLYALLPAPPQPTMAYMAPEERAACQWMQCDAGPAGRRGLITETADWAVHVVDKETGEHSDYSPDLVTPRPDLPRLEWPGDTPAPALALPDGWRLADHQKRGRVIVTTTPDPNGRVYFALPADRDRTGFGWNFCDHSELTYLDQEADQ